MEYKTAIRVPRQRLNTFMQTSPLTVRPAMIVFRTDTRTIRQETNISFDALDEESFRESIRDAVKRMAKCTQGVTPKSDVRVFVEIDLSDIAPRP